MTVRLIHAAPFVLGLTACAVDESPPAEPQRATVVLEDICDWSEPGDLTVTVRASAMTPAGLAVICEQSGATASSVVLIDTTTYARRDVYATTSIDIDEIVLADDDSTLVLGYTFGALYTVPLAGGTPARIFDRPSSWMHSPVAVGGWVYFASTYYEGSVAVHAIEKVALHGGPDQTPTVVTPLPHGFDFLVASEAGLHVFGIGTETLTVGLIDPRAASPTLQPIVSRPHVTYEPMGYRGAVADHVLWADYAGGNKEPARYVEIRGIEATATEVACPVDHAGTLTVGDHLVQVAWTSEATCPGVVVTNRANGAVRRGRHLEIGWQEWYRPVGLIGGRVFMLEGDTRYTHLAVSTLVPE